MKKRSCAIEFLLIFALFVLPPLTQGPASQPPRPALYPIQVFTNALCMALILYIQTKAAPRKKPEAGPRWLRCTVTAAAALAAFGGLCLSASLIQLTLYLLSGSQPATPLTLLQPESLPAWINCITGTAAAAFFEEALFRRYLPDTLAILLPKKDSRPSRAAAELIPLALFALSHRYLGTPSVINALACGLVLRLCTLKAGSLLPAVAAHTAYNGALLILSFGM